MGLKLKECVLVLSLCAIGIHYSSAFLTAMREIEQNCARDGGFCINTNVPQPRRRANNRAAAGAGAGARRGTRTRKGSRPDPRALGQQHTRLPASAGGAAAGGAPAAGAPAAGAPAAGGAQAPATQNNGGFLFGGGNDPFSSLFGMMMFSRKKRQAAMLDPADIADIPRRRPNQSMYSYLNAHCRKSEFDFGCRRTGGMCCLPFLK
ncbi:hypothetical protein ACF0H5_020044 [Mactra antiquata]